MRLVSFEIDGRPSFGFVNGDGVVDAGKRLGGKYRGLRDLLVAGALPELRKLEREKPDRKLAEVTLLPPIADAAAKLLCIGINYVPHMKEMGRERPEFPVVFVRFADSVVGHGQALERPRASKSFDYEGELAVVIGKRARHVSRSRAFDYVAGYSCFNDG